MTSGLSIITVTHQSAGKIAAFIQAARVACPHSEIIVVDNASSDGTDQTVRSSDVNATFIRSPYNVGFGRGCNIGAKHASSDWILFANPDLVLTSVEVPSVPSHRPFGLGAGWIAQDGGDTLVSGVRAESGLAEDWLQQIWKPFVPRSISQHMHYRRWPPRWPIGGMFIARRREFSKIGGFDSRYFLYFEDRDLGKRYQAAGMPIRVIEGLVGTHWIGSSSVGISWWRRHGWSIISWLEYVAVWRGPVQAVHTATQVLRSLVLIARLSNRSGLSDRVRTKAYHAGLTARFIMDFDQYLPQEAHTFYPCARAAIATARLRITA
jgi:GT2 family glycosyltransferase